jgi:hypothetical protein
MNEAERTGGLAEQNLPGGIVLFIIKTCIVAVAISACTILVANSVIESVEASAARTISNLREVPIGGRQFWAKMEQALDHAAEPSSDLSSEKKSKTDQRCARDHCAMAAFRRCRSNRTTSAWRQELTNLQLTCWALASNKAPKPLAETRARWMEDWCLSIKS